MKNFDFNLLVVAESVYRTTKLTQTAEELGLTQSAVSHALKRLGELYGKPLFVRGVKGMVETPFGRQMKPAIQNWYQESQTVAFKEKSFQPGKATGRIVISSTDYFEAVFAAQIMKRLEKEAPGVQLSFVNTLGQLPIERMEGGRIDLAIAGFYQNLPEGYMQKGLFKDQLKVMSRKKLSKKQYLAAKHLLVTISGDFDGMVDKELKKAGLRRDVLCGTSHFLSPLFLLQDSDHVLTAPYRLLKRYQKFLRYPIYACPVSTPAIQVRMIWHRRTQHDPLNQWMRQLIADICSTK